MILLFDRLARRTLGTCAIAAIAIAIVCTMPADAKAEINKPSGPVILTVSGAISESNAGTEAVFDRDMLKSLGMKNLVTSNPFDTGLQRYEGVLLSELLEHVGASGTTLVAIALDGYAVEIPISDTKKYPVMLAMIWNGTEMTVRNKGPIWIVYPVDQFDKLKEEIYSIRSIWQLSRLIVQ